MVVLIHGLCAHRVIMSPIGRRLRQRGYQVINWGYRSTARSIADHADQFLKLLEGVERDARGEHFHLVAHSMGAIVARLALARRRFPTLQRMIMLAPPNRGSHAARILAPWVRWFCRPMPELSDERDSFVNRLPDFQRVNSVQWGVIQAAYDRVIRPEAVRLPGQSDHAIVSSHHGLLPWHPEAIELVERFLRQGSFDSRAAQAAGAPRKSDRPGARDQRN